MSTEAGERKNYGFMNTGLFHEAIEQAGKDGYVVEFYIMRLIRAVEMWQKCQGPLNRSGCRLINHLGNSSYGTLRDLIGEPRAQEVGSTIEEFFKGENRILPMFRLG